MSYKTLLFSSVLISSIGNYFLGYFLAKYRCEKKDN